jgi:lysyl-tRNA synthetase class 1
MLPTLGPERRESYSPFLPISPTTGRVLQVPTLERNVAKGTIVYQDEDGQKIETPVTGGAVKVQWKPDWALRWTALGVDYEMAGKDLIDSVKVSSAICKVLGGAPPEGFNYELFLDENGEKISKTKGNGITVEEWLKYAPAESLSLYQFTKPKSAKKLYFDVIPKAVDDYLTFLAAYPTQSEAERLENAAWHIHAARPPTPGTDISFALLLNLVSAANVETNASLWRFISKYAPDVTPASDPFLDKLVGHALAYYVDFVKPAKRFRAPTDKERAALEDLAERFAALPAESTPEAIQNVVYAVGKEHEFEPLRDWFKAIYEVLLGQTQGPRFGSFVAIFGIEETRRLIAEGLAGKLIQAA